jgi:hypothetical protein
MNYPYSDVPAGFVPAATDVPQPGPAAAGVMGTMPTAAPAPTRGNGAAGGPTAFTPSSAEPGLPPGAGAPGDPLAALRAAMRAAGLLEASVPAAGE